MPNYNSALQSNNVDLQTILDTIIELPESSLPSLSMPAASNDILLGKEVIDENGNILVGTMPFVTQNAPSISVSSAGKITASVSYEEGYIAQGSKSATQQLTTQAAKTVTPTKSSQTAVAKGRYTTGAITVAAIPAEYITTTDATAVAADMRSGKTAYVNGSKVTGTIQDFDGSYECDENSTGSGGSGGSVETCTVIITSSIPINYLCATTMIDEGIAGYYYNYMGTQSLTTITIEKVVCGSFIGLYTGLGIPAASILNGGEIVHAGAGYITIRAPQEEGVTCTISLYDNI